jgi:hypothetical protein
MRVELGARPGGPLGVAAGTGGTCDPPSMTRICWWHGSLRRWSGPLLALGALSLLACGGESDGASSSSSSRVTAKRVFVRDANAVCQDSIDQAKSLSGVVAQRLRDDPLFRASDYTQAARIASSGAKIRQAADSRLARLRAPAGEERAVRAWVTARKRLSAQTRRYASALRARDLRAVRRLGPGLRARGRRHLVLAGRLGLRICSVA